jgi:hypothetical protein
LVSNLQAVNILHNGNLGTGTSHISYHIWKVLRLHAQHAAAAAAATTSAAAFIPTALLQVRHERPQGFIGVWPELALLRHSCAPNSSVVVVGKHALLHATADMDADTEVTFNKLGRCGLVMS